METNPETYDAGIDQNQGVVGTMARNEQHSNAEIDGTQTPQLDPNKVTEQADPGADTAADKTPDTLGEQEYVAEEEGGE